ncbi:hypothetical protein ABZ719_35475 [Streptomyces sp. NPDC006743]|uniref:hypothetical protein n=1 Tax=Streptomyces sp. NPDC006743 TaxID=3154480 RepID=UPI003454E7DE
MPTASKYDPVAARHVAFREERWRRARSSAMLYAYNIRHRYTERTAAEKLGARRSFRAIIDR